VLLRGLTREARHWGDFGARLARATSAGAVHALDLPGWGARRSASAPATIATTATLVADDARAFTTDGPIIVVGLSLGGMVALEWARQAPEQIRGLVLVSTSAGGLSPPWQRLRPAALAALLPLLALPARELRERRVLALTAALAGRDPTAVAALTSAWATLARQAAPTWRRRAIAQLWAGARYRFVAPPARPTLVLAGGRDRLVDARCARAIAERLGAELRVHPDAGHDLPLDAPDWVCERIAQWLIDTNLSQSC
jgi:pimeloyl-ACP methyl ester carboxylesterase